MKRLQLTVRAFRAEVCALVCFSPTVSYKTFVGASSAIQETGAASHDSDKREESGGQAHQLAGHWESAHFGASLKRLAWKTADNHLTVINDEAPDSKLSARVLRIGGKLWISSTHLTSPVFDDSLTYDILPKALRYCDSLLAFVSAL